MTSPDHKLETFEYSFHWPPVAVALPFTSTALKTPNHHLTLTFSALLLQIAFFPLTRLSLLLLKHKRIGT
jgi:hypothetical protein